MKCIVCSQNFVQNISFSSLFSKQIICAKCKGSFHLNVGYEAIPIYKGMIYYFSLCEEETEDIFISEAFLNEMGDLVYLIYKNVKYGTLLIIDKCFFINIDKDSIEILYDLCGNKLFFISFFYINLSRFECLK